MFTYPWEPGIPPMRTSSADEQPRFTPEEFARLVALRTHLQRCGLDVELGLDMRRLRFARWLVEHGRLSEDVSAL